MDDAEALSAPLLAPSNRHKAAAPDAVPGGWRRRGLVLALILLGAAFLSWVCPVGTNLPCPYCRASSMVGWTYFLMWTVSFYPQLIINYRRKSVEGISLDFLAMNVTGFACYAIFNLSLVWNPVVKHEYQERFGTVGVPVEWNDVFFALHALVLSLAVALQCLVYPKGSSRVTLGTSLGLTASVLGGIGFASYLSIYGEGEEAPFTWLDLCYYCSIVKMGITLLKYVPQVHMNHRRQSTEGWSIDNVLLDLGGGTLSIVQLFMSCYVLNDWTAVTGNPIKFGLGLTSVGFDLVFIMQHYVWYRHGSKPLLPQYITEHASSGTDAVVVVQPFEALSADEKLPLSTPFFVPVRQ